MTRTDVTDQDRLRAPATAEEPLRRQETTGPETSTKVAAGGSTLEAVAGLAGVVLAIIGLVSSGNTAFYMVTIATIVVGVAVMMQGASVGARFTRLVKETGAGAAGASEVGSGISAEFLGGAAGVVLGILALLNVVPMILIAVTAIVLGGALLVGGGATSQLSHLESAGAHGARRETAVANLGAGGADVFVGLAAIILGILALVGINAMTLNLVALLVLAGGVILSGGALAGQMLSVIRR